MLASAVLKKTLEKLPMLVINKLDVEASGAVASWSLLTGAGPGVGVLVGDAGAAVGVGPVVGVGAAVGATVGTGVEVGAAVGTGVEVGGTGVGVGGTGVAVGGIGVGVGTGVYIKYTST